MNTVLLGLNEINLDYVKKYIEAGQLPNFKKIFKNRTVVRTISEERYELWEPWIQWVTIHTGKSYQDHQIFRLGDIVSSGQSQIFEELQELNYSVGAVSPFNAENRTDTSLFFLPDPWTDTSVTGTVSTKLLYKTIKKLVNNNTNMKLSFVDALSFLVGFFKFVPLVRWRHYLNCIVGMKNPGIKAVVLDSLLSDLFMKLFVKNKPDFSVLFLNSGAHIQHHYMFNSKMYDGTITNPEWYCSSGIDPLLTILKEYDDVVGKLHNMPDVNLIIATGLTQVPHESLTYYWRPKKHEELLTILGIEEHIKILPLMSRDFLVYFANEEDAEAAELALIGYVAKDTEERMFTIDNRGLSLFVELSFAHAIDSNFSIVNKSTDFQLDRFIEHVAFVAIKNGEHDGSGYLVSSHLDSDVESMDLCCVKEHLMDIVQGKCDKKIIASH